MLILIEIASFYEKAFDFLKTFEAVNIWQVVVAENEWVHGRFVAHLIIDSFILRPEILLIQFIKDQPYCFLGTYCNIWRQIIVRESLANFHYVAIVTVNDQDRRIILIDQWTVHTIWFYFLQSFLILNWTSHITVINLSLSLDFSLIWKFIFRVLRLPDLIISLFIFLFSTVVKTKWVTITRILFYRGVEIGSASKSDQSCIISIIWKCVTCLISLLHFHSERKDTPFTDSLGLDW